MRKIVSGLVLVLSCGFAMAGGWGATASVTCGFNGDMYRPALNITYSTGSDAGTPGLLGIGVMLPDMSDGVVYSDGEWAPYKGGLYPFESRFDDGFPAVITRSLAFPGNSHSTGEYFGYMVFIGHGAYTDEARHRVEVMRSARARNKETLLKKGKWTAQMEASTGPDFELRYIWSLIQKDGIDNQKFGKVISIPIVDCSPPYTSH